MRLPQIKILMSVLSAIAVLVLSNGANGASLQRSILSPLYTISCDSIWHLQDSFTFVGQGNIAIQLNEFGDMTISSYTGSSYTSIDIKVDGSSIPIGHPLMLGGKPTKWYSLTALTGRLPLTTHTITTSVMCASSGNSAHFNMLKYLVKDNY